MIQARGLKALIEAAIEDMAALPDMVEAEPSVTVTSMESAAKGIVFDLSVVVPSYMKAVDVRHDIEAGFAARSCRHAPSCAFGKSECLTLPHMLLSQSVVFSI